jgi:acyl-CoA dehydrogenase
VDAFNAARPAATLVARESAAKRAEIVHRVHGAIGFTHEHGLHRLTRRLVVTRRVRH